jgi:hypothetical protein
MKLSDEAKKQALEAARRVKDAADAPTLPATTESSQEMATGSPRTPGYDEHQGKTMKPAPQWPKAREAQGTDTRDSAEQNRDRDAATDNDIDR